MKRIYVLILSLIMICSSVVSVNAASKPTPVIKLGYTVKTVYGSKGQFVTGTISVAKNQRVILYDSKGKPISVQRLPNSNSSQSFKLPTPTLSSGNNTFIVRSEQTKNVNASNAVAITLRYTKATNTSTSQSTVASSGARGAVEWAKMIAADDSFSYGKKPKASACGCYFCGTNCGPVKYNKPKGYEKTYVCCTFIVAAYAHGAKDPTILNICKKGRTLSGSNPQPSQWTKTGVFKQVYPSSISDLQPGDVFLCAQHVSMYAGDGKYVDANSAGNPWGPNSIAVRKLSNRTFKGLTGRGVVRYIGPKK